MTLEGTPRVKNVSLESQDAAERERMRRILTEQFQRGMMPPGTTLAAILAEQEKHQSMGRPARTSCQGFALAKSAHPSGRIFAPQVLVDPGDSSQRASGYGDDNSPTEMPSIAVVDGASAETLAASVDPESAPRLSRRRRRRPGGVPAPTSGRGRRRARLAFGHLFRH